jgi:hypothetical protein
MSAPEQGRTVARWKMERGELTYHGRCPAPEPRAAGVQEGAPDPLAQLHRERDDDQPAWRESS